MPISKRELWPGWGSLLLFMASAVAVASTLLARGPAVPVHELRDYHLFDELHGYHFFDLRVYRRAAEIVSHHRPLYATKLRHGLGFTYPPAAVLMFLSLSWLPLGGDELAVMIINIALVAVVAHTALKLRAGSATHSALRLRDGSATSGSSAVRRARLRRRRIAAGWLAAAAVLWVEPVTTTLGYGQIDLLIAALVVVDLTHGRHSRAGGLGIGLAAALKLTPLIFIPYLLLTGRFRMATRALAAFGLSIGIAFAAVPGDATTYWLGGKYLDLSRVTGRDHLAGSGAANQSLRGTVLRILSGGSPSTLIWVAACLVIGSLGLLLAVVAARRGDEAWGFMLTALTGLLISPVSWTHHWTIAVAGAIAVAGVRGRPVLSALRTILVLVFGLAASAIWLIIVLGPGNHPGPRAFLLGNLYVLAGVGVIATVGLLELRRLVRRRGRARRTRRIAPVMPAPRRPALAPTPFTSVAPGHPGDSLRAITTGQALAPDRQSL